jgi:hypothetical protein
LQALLVFASDIRIDRNRRFALPSTGKDLGHFEDVMIGQGGTKADFVRLTGMCSPRLEDAVLARTEWLSERSNQPSQVDQSEWLERQLKLLTMLSGITLVTVGLVASWV